MVGGGIAEAAATSELVRFLLEGWLVGERGGARRGAGDRRTYWRFYVSE